MGTSKNQVLQSGNVTPSHIAAWTTDGVIADGGMTLAQILVDNNTNFLTPAQFGCVGNGSTNDTTNMQTAFNTAATQKLPLLVVGNFTYIVDSVTIPSNLTIWGDGNSTFKLKNSAVGSVFVLPTSTTTDNVWIEGLILDGNFAGQPGAPHNLIHSIFYAADSTCLVTNSKFCKLYAHDIDGELFGGNGSGADGIFTDCQFIDIRVFLHTQTAIALQVVRCFFERIRIDNASNTNVPASGQGGCYGMSLKGSDTTVRNIRISLTTTLQGTTDRAGLALTASANTVGNNLVDSVDVDCGGVAHNFAYTIDTGSGNRLNNLIARNGAYNCDFEIFNQVDLQGNNWYSLGDLSTNVGILWDGCSYCSLQNYTYNGTTQLSDGIRFSSNVYGVNSDIGIDRYIINTQGEGLRFTSGGHSNIRLTNGEFINLSVAGGFFGIFMDGGSATTNVAIDGLTINGCGTPWHLNNLQNSSFNNINVVSAANNNFEQLSNCANITYSNLYNVSFQRQASGTYGISALIGSDRILSYYAFAVHGGAIGTINLDPVIPPFAVIKTVYFFTTTTPTSATNAATISFGVSAGGSATTLAAALTAHTQYVAGNFRFGAIDGSTAGLFYFTGVAANPTITIAGEALTAGVIELLIEYDTIAF